MKVRIRCKFCRATREGHLWHVIRAEAKKAGWGRADGKDICGACRRRHQAGVAAERDGAGKTPAAAAPQHRRKAS